MAGKKQGSATPEFLEALKNFMYWENYDVRVGWMARSIGWCWRTF